jgi:hypothetical protein
LEQSGRCPQCHIPETQAGYTHMRIGNSLGIVTTDVLAATQVKAEGRVQPGLFRFQGTGAAVRRREAFSPPQKPSMKVLPAAISVPSDFGQALVFNHGSAS